MPPGAKKRKAAKKKKKKDANNLSNNNHNNYPSSIIDGNHQGDDDSISQDERESDGGDGSSPVSQEHNDRLHPFDEGNEVMEKSNPSHVASHVTNSKPADEVAKGSVGGLIVGLENGVIETDREEKFERDAQGQDVIIQNLVKEDLHEVDCGSRETVDFEEYLIPKREVNVDAHGSVSNGVSSDGKEKADCSLEEEIVQSSVTEKPLNYANSNLNLDSTPNTDLFNSVLPMSEVVNCVWDSAQVESAEILDVTGFVLRQNEDKLLHKSNEYNGTSLAEKNEEKPFSELGENVEKFSAESAPVCAVGGEMLTSSGAGADDDTIENAENCEVSKVYGISLTAEKEDRVFPVLDGNGKASSDAASATLNEDEIKVLTISGVQAVDSIEDAGKHVASKVNGISLTVEKEDKVVDGSDGNIEASPDSATVSEDEFKMLTMSGVHATDSLEDALKHGDSKANSISVTEEKEDEVGHVMDRNIEASSDAASATVFEDEVKMWTMSGAHAVHSIEDGGRHVASKVNGVLLTEEKEDKVVDASDGTAEASSDATSATVSEDEVKLLTPSGACTVDSFENSRNHVPCMVNRITLAEEKEDKVFPVLDENVEASSDASVDNVNSDERKLLTLSSCHTTYTIENAGNDQPLKPSSVAANGNQGIILKSSGACTKQTGNYIELTKEIQTSESAREQPLIAPKPQVRTSWLSCCGLLEVFTGSGR